MVKQSNRVIIEHKGREFVVKQVAGGLARRLGYRVQLGGVVRKGQR